MKTKEELKEFLELLFSIGDEEDDDIEANTDDNQE